MAPILSATDLHLSYGPIAAVRGFTFEIAPGETVAVVGANGAGKTTIMRGLSGLLAPVRGTVAFMGAPVGRRRPHELARAGLLHIPEGRGTIGGLSVRDNLRIAYDIRPHTMDFDAALQPVFARFPRLRERQEQRAGQMSGGEQQMLALARALINPPTVLLVDEPSLGLSPVMVKEAFAILREFRDGGMTILLVEQNVRLALRLAHRAYVLRQGEVVMSGSAGDLLSRPQVLEAYLGAHS